uniref:RNA/RNP complex-1-interacting phosphatase isoform X8 n=1 Tax=Gasterosteus aculeatus aculeatus TaxID=481459 RepID=UPI001A99E8B7|nr:RNA/RNP complex-1-interacting phosphatase isoform X8 [Gasterosteus aculeatus aculeatus]
MPRHGVPLRWLDYSAVGKRLNGTRFIAFKVPLKQSLNQQLPSSDVFGLWELLDTLKREDQELGLIIDLTFTTRYYSLQDVPDSLLVMKIFTAGHEVPSNKTILSFKRAVGAFLRDHADNDMLIGVHCTHGLNRTGYLICRYLIDVDGMDPKEAVALFNSSRGHAMERQNYLDDLLRGPKRRSVSNSNEGMQEAEQEPMRGLASQRRLSAPPLKDHSRPFPPRGASQRSHKHHLNFPSPSMGAPPPSYQWRTSHADSQWRSPPCSEGSRSRYAHPDHRRARYGPPGDSRSRNAHPDPRRLKYASPLDSRSRNALQRSAGLDMLLQRTAGLDMLLQRTAGLDMLLQRTAGLDMLLQRTAGLDMLLQRTAGLDMLLQRSAVLDMLLQRAAGLDMLLQRAAGLDMLLQRAAGLDMLLQRSAGLDMLLQRTAGLDMLHQRRTD